MDIHTTIERIRAIREAGKVERSHTMPHHGSYSNGEHSWNVATLVVLLHPNPRKELVIAALLHDVPERWNGDPPSPSKWGKSRRKLKEEYREAHDEVYYGLGLDQFGLLNTEELQWLKACDMLEYNLWCWDQINMGNVRAGEGRGNSSHWFDENRDIVPKEIMEFLGEYNWTYTSDIDGWNIKND